MARIVLNTFGSFGDVHPYLALALELKRRGHNPVVATAAVYRSKIEEEGLEFAPVRPDVGELQHDAAAARKLWHPTRGSEYLIRDYLIPQAENSYQDLLPVCRDADLLLTHFAGFGGPIVAAKLGLRWLSVVLQPSVFLSSDEPPALPNITWLPALRKFGRWPVAAVLAGGRKVTNHWARPLADLRHKEGLDAPGRSTLFEFSPWGTLALFSRYFAAPQVDWPANVEVTGFSFYDRRGSLPGMHEGPEELSALERFLDAGPPPVLFTLGSSAVMQAGTFYQEGAEAARKLGVRAILLVGMLRRVDERGLASADVHVASYAPYSRVMPRCSATVHQGGIGTTAQALRAGRPMIVVPWSHDQPDNAYRVERLGVGRSIGRKHYTQKRVQDELKRLLSDVTYAKRAQVLGDQIRAEDGIQTASDAIERTLRSS